MLATNFVRGANPVWSFVDLNGLQFDDTYYMYVLTNTVPYIPAPVYTDTSGTIPWGFPIQFLGNGTLPINIFWDDTQVYRIEIRKNNGVLPPSQNDPLIYLIEDYIPTGSIVMPGETTGTNTENLITNAQFSAVNFSESYFLNSVTNPATIEIAPGWFLTLVGTGSVVVTQVPLDTALSNPTNAPYALQLALTGSWTSPPLLYQRFFQNGQNWQNKWLSTSITALIATSPMNFIVRLTASNGQPLGVLINAPLTNAFAQYTGSMFIPSYANLNIPPNAYIDYQIYLPTVGDIYLTSVQLIAGDENVQYDYEQDTIERQQDHMSHYFIPKLAYKPIPSYLVGWDFPKNPAQRFGDSIAAANTANQAAYFWDQTIVYQTLASGVSGARAANGGLTLTAASATAGGQIAVIQYLDQVEARKILNDRASVHISASTTAAAGSLGGIVSLWATTDATLPTLPTAFISTLAPSGLPATVSGAWVQVPNIYQNDLFTLEPASATNSEYADISLNGWDEQGAAIANTATFFAIVIGFEAWAHNDTVTLNSISLCPGDIATRPAPKTLAETILDCEQYFFKTFENATIPAQNVGLKTGELTFIVVSNAGGTASTNCVELPFPVPMRVNPTVANVTLYNPHAANALARNETTDVNDATATTVYSVSTKSVVVSMTGSIAGGQNVGQIFGVHLTANAQLGVV